MLDWGTAHPASEKLMCAVSGSPSIRALLVGEGDLSHGGTLRRLGITLDRLPGVAAEVHVVEEPSRLAALAVRHFDRLGPLDFQNLRWRLRYSARARRHLVGAADGADVALVNTQACALLARGPMRRCPTVISVDSTNRQFAALEYWRPRSALGYLVEAPIDLLERRAYARARRVLAWTEWTARSLREDYGVPAERIAVVHPGVDLPPLAPRASEPGTGELRVLFVGNNVVRKGLGELLAAARAIHAPVRIDVISTDPAVPADDSLVRVHRGARAGEPLHRRLFAAADVLVLPTRADAVPWVVVEGLAAGLPVVATQVGAIPELVGDAGLVVPAGDVGRLAEALDRLAGDPALRQDLGARARARAEARFDAARQVPRVLEVLEQARASVERR